MSFTWAHQNVSSDLPELYKFYKVALKVMNQKSGQTILNLKRMAQTHTFTFMVAYSWNFSLNFYWFIASVINFYAIWHRNLCCFHVYVCLCTCVCVCGVTSSLSWSTKWFIVYKSFISIEFYACDFDMIHSYARDKRDWWMGAQPYLPST